MLQLRYAMLKQGLEDSISVAKKQLGEATQTRATTEEELHAAEGALTETEATLAADTKYLEELKMSCETKARDCGKDALHKLLRNSMKLSNVLHIRIAVNSVAVRSVWFAIQIVAGWLQ